MTFKGEVECRGQGKIDQEKEDVKWVRKSAVRRQYRRDCRSSMLNSNSHFLLFAKHNCLWCTKAKELLRENKFYFEELIYGEDFTREYIRNLLGKAKHETLTLPQIFDIVDPKKAVHVGGFAELEKYVKRPEGESEI